MLAKLINGILRPLGLRVSRLRETPGRSAPDRHVYQSQYIDFSIQSGERVIDIGSGHQPFPRATVLCDLSMGPSADRHLPLALDERPMVVADVHRLPFPDKTFDFAYCSHVLEHVRDPMKACREIQRIARRGYIETPTYCKDALFSWARGMHRWHVVAHGRFLVFFEYTEKQLDGCRSNWWRDQVHAATHNPLQDFFLDNQDVFNVMFLWEGGFSVQVFRNHRAPELYFEDDPHS